MWILSILPDSAIHIIFGLGILGTIAGFVLGFIPFIKAYKLAIQVCSILLLAFGVYLEGGLADSAEWELKVKEMEAKIAKLEADSANANVQVQAKVVEKTKIIHEKGRTLIQYVDREVVKKEEIIKYVERCPVPQELVDLHNQAAELNKGDKK